MSRGLVMRMLHPPVAMQEHRALGQPGGTSRVLQERDVFVADVDALQAEPLSLRDHGVEADRARDLPSRNHFLHAAHDEIHDRSLRAEQVAERGDHHVLHGGSRDHLLEHVGEVLQNHDYLGTGVPQLVLELARGVERIDVDHDVAGTQDAENAHGVLQAVRHHYRDPRALCEPFPLKPGAEGPRQTL